MSDTEEETPPDGNSPDAEVKVARVNTLLYNITDIPPIVLTGFCALQACVQLVSLCLTSSVLVSEAICGSAHLTAKLLSTSMFLSGLTTFLQSTIGVRLPVFQGPTVTYVVPVLARAELSDWKCVPPIISNNTNMGTLGQTVSYNSTSTELSWEHKLAEISGGLMIVSAIHALIGATGVGGRMAKIIGPLTIAPGVTVMILVLADKLIQFTLIQLGVAAFTTCLMVVTATYMANVLVPYPNWTRKEGWHIARSNFIRTYAIIISIGIGWFLSYILTIAGVFSDDPADLDFQARTDNKWDAVELANWFYVPYPGQLGLPKFGLAVFFGLFVAMLSSVIDSVADYEIVSKLANVPKPPPHSVNRGLLTEGFCTILSGIFGVGHATSTNVAVTGSLALTGVTSLRVFQVTGLVLMLLGVVGKIGAVLVMIPKPVIGAVMVVVFGSVIGVLLAGLSELDMKKPRNSVTVGLAILLGTMIPKMMVQNQDLVNTGIPEIDHAISSICGTPLFVAGGVACFLDNTLPGGRRSRKSESGPVKVSGDEHPVYRLPFLHNYFVNCWWTRYCPFLPGPSQYNTPAGL